MNNEYNHAAEPLAGVAPEAVSAADVPATVAELEVEPATALAEKQEESISFEDLGVSAPLLHAIQDMGFERPMPIQQMVIPKLLTEDRDAIGLAQTGTGKTAAFGLPLLQRTDVSTTATQALVIAPTRELCLQIAGDLADFSRYIDNLRVLPVYGGSSIESQIRTLRKGVQVIVATPGRLIDLIKRGEVKLDAVHTVVLDEADEMLNMGFLDDINEILTHVPEQRRMLMFSATMPREIAGIASRFMKDAVECVAGSRNEGAHTVRHIYYMVKAHDKYLALKRVADNNPAIYGIIFCRTKRETQEIADKLIADGYNADCLHGDLSQAQRDLAMKKFRDHVTQLLVATDVAARGLDVDDLTHVINYGLPDDAAVYTHRSGRTGRAGKTGVSVAIIHSREKGKLRDIEKRIKKDFEYRQVPTPGHIIEKQLYHLADRLERVEVDEKEMEKYLPGVRKKLEWLSEEDLLKRVLSLEFNRLLRYYQDMPDINLNAESESTRAQKKERASKPKNNKEKDRRSAEQGFTRIYVNVGKAQGFFPGNLMQIINRGVQGAKPEIGRIDLLSGYTLFDVRSQDARRVIAALKGDEFYGTRLYAEEADPERDYGSGKSRSGKGGKSHISRRDAKVAARGGDGAAHEDSQRRFVHKGKPVKSRKAAKPADTAATKKKMWKHAGEITGQTPAEIPAKHHGNFEIFMKKGKK